jgi:hypothetical protein
MDEKCLKFINVKRKNVQCLQDKYILKVKQTKLQVKSHYLKKSNAILVNFVYGIFHYIIILISIR